LTRASVPRRRWRGYPGLQSLAGRSTVRFAGRLQKRGCAAAALCPGDARPGAVTLRGNGRDRYTCSTRYAARG
jgi:hypothetical protein